MTRTIHTAAVLAALALVACKETPERAFKKLQAASCEGDVPGTFRYIDKTKLAEKFSERVTADSAKHGALAGAMAPALAKRAADDGFTQWEDDIKRGKESSFCGAKFESSDPETGRVSWLTPSGKSKTGYFEKAGDTWLLVSLEDR